MSSEDSLTVLETGDNNWQLGNGVLRVAVAGQHGADITSIEYLPTHRQVLWSDPRATSVPSGPSGDDAAGFYDSYTGGIQDLFPNAGPACTVMGAPLPFHGESHRRAWSISGSKTGEWVQLECRSRLRRYPFSLVKRVRLLANEATILVDSTITNESQQRLPVHWGFHPAFSHELTAAPASLIGQFGKIKAEKSQFGSRQSYTRGADIAVTREAKRTKLPLVEGTAGSADLAYTTCDRGWFVISSEATGLAAGLRWPVDVFPQLWIWQECQDPSGYPWWGLHHIVGVEPHTAAPSQGLAVDVQKDSCLWVGPEESCSARFEIFVTQVEDDGLEQFIRHVSSPLGATDQKE